MRRSVRELLRAGADKVAINTAAVYRRNLSEMSLKLSVVNA